MPYLRNPHFVPDFARRAPVVDAGRGLESASPFRSRRASLYEEFLKERLASAKRYDRIAGYFQSSLFDLANDPFYNLRYDKGVDQWVKDMLENKRWDDNTVLTVISDQRENPFALKETTESLDADWESTAEVLNQADVFRELLGGW